MYVFRSDYSHRTKTNEKLHILQASLLVCKAKSFDHNYLEALFDPAEMCTDNNVYILLSYLYYHSKLCC